MQSTFNDEEILRGIRSRDREILVYTYQQYLPMIRNFIKKNSGMQIWVPFEREIKAAKKLFYN